MLPEPRCSLPLQIVGSTPSLCNTYPEGACMRAQVKINSPSFGSRRTCWTVPLPKLLAPTTIARPWSCRADATISAADAEAPSISTAMGRPLAMDSLLASKNCWLRGWRPRVRRIAPWARNRSAISTA